MGIYAPVGQGEADGEGDYYGLNCLIAIWSGRSTGLCGGCYCASDCIWMEDDVLKYSGGHEGRRQLWFAEANL